MNPFLTYLPMYAPGSVPERPWWRCVGTIPNDGVTALYQRADAPEWWSAELPLEMSDLEIVCVPGWSKMGDFAARLFDALDAYDDAHPIPAPPPMLTQVWVGPSEDAFTIDFAASDYPVNGGNAPVWGVSFTRYTARIARDRLYTAEELAPLMEGAVLVLGPTPWGRDVPWAPKGWRPTP